MRAPSPTLALALGALLSAAVVYWQPGIRVIDGDTVEHGFWRYRIAGVDTPELRGRCPEEKVLAQQARNRLQALIGGGRGRLRYLGRRDAYGRRLGLLEAGGKDVAETLISEGVGRPNRGERRAPWCLTTKRKKPPPPLVRGDASGGGGSSGEG